MADHRYTATIEWVRQPGIRFTDGRYSRVHHWLFDGGAAVTASPAAANVPAPYSDPEAVDPEEAFVAALSSCHMLFFLHLAGKQGLVVDSYRDEAVGLMTTNERGKLWVSHVALAPAVAFSGERLPDEATIAELHHRAHEECFLANSVRTEVTVAPATRGSAG